MDPGAGEKLSQTRWPRGYLLPGNSFLPARLPGGQVGLLDGEPEPQHSLIIMASLDDQTPNTQAHSSLSPEPDMYCFVRKRRFGVALLFFPDLMLRWAKHVPRSSFLPWPQ